MQPEVEGYNGCFGPDGYGVSVSDKRTLYLRESKRVEVLRRNGTREQTLKHFRLLVASFNCRRDNSKRDAACLLPGMQIPFLSICTLQGNVEMRNRGRDPRACGRRNQEAWTTSFKRASALAMTWSMAKSTDHLGIDFTSISFWDRAHSACSWSRVADCLL